MIKTFNIGYLALPVLFAGLMFLGIGTYPIFIVIGFFGLMIMFALFPILFKLAKNKLNKELSESTFISNHTFNAGREYLMVDLNRREIAIVFKYNPFKHYIVSLDDVAEARVNDFRQGSGFMEGTNRVGFQFKLKGAKITVYTFTAQNRRFTLDSKEVLTGISKAQMMVDALTS